MKKKMLYSPRIHESLVPSLYYTAKDRGMPMTDLVSGFVYRNLATEALPPEAIARCPTDWKNPLTDGLQRFLPDGCEEGVHRRLIDIIEERAKWAVPFEDLDELDSWREQTLDGLSRAYASAEKNLHSPGVRRNVEEMNHAWVYETYALNVQAAYMDALPHVMAQTLRPSFDQGGDYRGRAV